ncbi:MAG: hypothetical protein HKN48_07855 [Flavobacteriaceae bacterium]|nr:hypothetical protein [Flavobacteriaceae bacterium]
MKRSLLVLALFFCFSMINGQGIIDPVKWKISLNKANDNRVEIVIDGKIDEGWHIYSQKQFGEEFEGPIPTEFAYNNSDSTFTLVGGTIEPEIKPIYDEVFEMDVVYFEGRPRFTQLIDVTNPEDLFINVEIYYSVCDDTQCLAPETKTFEIPLDGGEAVTVSADVSEEDLIKAEALTLDLKGKEQFETLEQEKKGLWTIFFLGFLGGLIALLTPCVFPMIPLTVSFFTKSGRSKKQGLINAILYGLFIFLIYLLLSIPFHVLDSVNPDILNNISTNTILNTIFFVIFIAFAFSFFGYYELTLPSSWSSAMDSKATSVGGVIGIFFMALTLAIVSFSCTGPILGTLLGSSLTSDSGATQLSMGMGGFGLALALPFALFALFPNWLTNLPKSGGWLNTVKVVLGFIELGLAFKFLSNADLVEHWGLLKREIFIGIWIVCSLGIALYLFGVIRFPHDGPKTKKIPKGNVFVAAISIAFLIYLIPGLTNTKYANLKLLSGFPPPLFYSLYDKGTSAPLGLEAYKDFYEGVDAAKAAGKPIMVDFTGWACVNCRKMEEQVWSEDEIFEVISKEYVLISLYVDDRKELSEEEKFNYPKPNGSVKEIITVGDKWATFQTINFQNNSQPYYILLDSDLNFLNKPVGYTPDSDEYLAWLKEGVENFKNK